MKHLRNVLIPGMIAVMLLAGTVTAQAAGVPSCVRSACRKVPLGTVTTSAVQSAASSNCPYYGENCPNGGVCDGTCIGIGTGTGIGAGNGTSVGSGNGVCDGTGVGAGNGTGAGYGNGVCDGTGAGGHHGGRHR